MCLKTRDTAVLHSLNHCLVFEKGFFLRASSSGKSAVFFLFFFFGPLRSLKPSCVNHGLCVGDIKPPSTSPTSPAGLHTHTLTHPHKHARGSLKGTFTAAPSFTSLAMGDPLSTELRWGEEFRHVPISAGRGAFL